MASCCSVPDDNAAPAAGAVGGGETKGDDVDTLLSLAAISGEEKQDGKIVPFESEDFTFQWSEAQNVGGLEKCSEVLLPQSLQFLEDADQCDPSIGSAALLVRHEFGMSLKGALWTPGRSSAMLQTMRSIPQAKLDPYEPVPAGSALQVEIVADELNGGFAGEGSARWQLSLSCFESARPRLVRLDGEKGHWFSRKLHHAVLNLVTNAGRDVQAANRVLRERFGVEVFESEEQAERLMEQIKVQTNEGAASFQPFHPEELVAILNDFEDMPSGYHKVPGMRFLLRRRDGIPHPMHPSAAAVTWPQEGSGYIEFMDKSFTGMDHFQRHRLILHEKQHMIWAHLLSQDVKDAWALVGGWAQTGAGKDEWETSKSTEFVSAYAHSHNPDEDLAESVAFFILNPDKLRSRSPPKYDFIRSRLMEGARFVAAVREDLTFQVYNLWPRYSYPGKICRIDVRVKGAPEEDKEITVEIELDQGDGSAPTDASGAYFRLFSRVDTWVDVRLQPPIEEMKACTLETHAAGTCVHFADQAAGGVIAGHMLRGSVPLSKHAAAGNWLPREGITVTDATGLQRFEGTCDFGWRCFVQNPLEIVAPPLYAPDTALMRVAPALNAEQPLEQTLTVSYGVQSPDWTRGAKNGVWASIVNPESGQYALEAYGTDGPEDGPCTVQFKITQFMASGVYELRRIMMKDIAENGGDAVFGGGREDAQPPVSIAVSTETPDLTKPELDVSVGRLTVTARPKNAEAPDGETIVTITYWARDPPDAVSGASSGVGKVSGTLRDPQGGQHQDFHYHPDFYTSYFSQGDPAAWREYTWERILPAGSAPGKWGLSEMSIKDKAGNTTECSFVEIFHFEIESQ